MSEKGNAPRFFVASKIKNMVKNIPNISPMAGKGKTGAGNANGKNSDNDTIHSFHISESQQKPFLDCDSLFTECEEFLKLSYRAIEINNNKGKSGLSKLVHAVPISDKISKWASKKKDNDLVENYEAIQSKVEQMDATLNEISNVSATSTSALITQSVHLNVRLTACIDYNRSEVDKNKHLVAEGRAFVNKLKSTESTIASMIDFLEEVNELKRTEPKAYIPWALRQQYEDEAEAERKAAMARNEIVELKRESLERRLRRIRKVLVPVERLFHATEQQQHVRLNNLSHCLRSQLALLNFLHRCQTATGSAGPVQALMKASGGPAGSSAPIPPPPASSPGATAPKPGGFMNFSNPIKALQGKTPAAPAKVATPAAAALAPPVPYKPTLAELASGMVPGGTPGGNRASMGQRTSEGSNPASARNSEASMPAGSAKSTVAAGAGAESFDQDDEGDSDVDDDGEEVDDPSNPDNSIEKAVRHMRVALTSLQRNSGLILEKVEPYDHNNCSDCAVVYDMANDCCMHIAAANFRSKQCAERLLRLQSYKDRMKENADLLDTAEP